MTFTFYTKYKCIYFKNTRKYHFDIYKTYNKCIMVITKYRMPFHMYDMLYGHFRKGTAFHMRRAHEERPA